MPLLVAALFWRRSTKWGALAVVVWVAAGIAAIAAVQMAVPPPAGPPTVLWDVGGLAVVARAASGVLVLNLLPVPMLDGILPSNERQVERALAAVLAAGKRRVALLGLAFKAGTDDLRESPLLELAKRLIGEGVELSIHDSAVLLSRLHGSNRAFLEERIPHISRLLRQEGLSVQQPIRRASQRDETQVAAWRDETWPALQAKPKPRSARSSA